eukprot:Skav236144  [mRNA]  locus=scaffold88:187076:193945:+ [translate_table: standard]
MAPTLSQSGTLFGSAEGSSGSAKKTARKVPELSTRSRKRPVMRTRTPASSRASRIQASCSVSPRSTRPAGSQKPGRPPEMPAGSLTSRNRPSGCLHTHHAKV